MHPQALLGGITPIMQPLVVPRNEMIPPKGAMPKK